ncbi:outer membrane lipoprotein-sorting protein [bacterium]|nr:outer membrane lipoprotein-sorting protein [bacterium]
MRARLFIICFLLAMPIAILAQNGNEILKRVDENMGAESRIHESTMIIHGRRGTRTVTSRSWIIGIDKSFTEFLSPARERGTKMLKLEDELWTYSPSTDRTIRIAGHMLRQSVMGSDLSYEDAMEDPHLPNIYTAEKDGEETILERNCWILKLTATKNDVAYHSRRLWVDKTRYLVLKEERFAKSGKLLKTAEVKAVKRMDNRWVATHMVFRDMLKKGKGTEFKLNKVTFNANIPAHRFSKAALR